MVAQEICLPYPRRDLTQGRPRCSRGAEPVVPLVSLSPQPPVNTTPIPMSSPQPEFTHAPRRSDLGGQCTQLKRIFAVAFQLFSLPPISECLAQSENSWYIYLQAISNSISPRERTHITSSINYRNQKVAAMARGAYDVSLDENGVVNGFEATRPAPKDPLAGTNHYERIKIRLQEHALADEVAKDAARAEGREYPGVPPQPIVASSSKKRAAMDDSSLPEAKRTTVLTSKSKAVENPGKGTTFREIKSKGDLNGHGQHNGSA
ncbi:hypothetical protein BDV95DRAFT_341714 [Massariosphaeria phaeospora]|uniref:Uncharacterized protein n=1 Tax=Massariosphaeria phaeospora TaxID=100035 RepID=A0A7C8IAH2_9PLEO|nr:hypothetical protein BDV95DRAFT_341714 [Massariosphaeria phaeospora]